MNARRLIPRLCLSIYCLAAASPAFGLANRVFVSARSGNDANSCDNVNTPCKTLAGAVAQLNPNGEAIVLDSGGYGPVTITQGVTIEAPPGVLAFIHPPGSTPAVTVAASSADVVVLRGLTLNVGSGDGIQVTAVGMLHVENCVISGFAGNGLSFASAGQFLAEDTIVRNNGGSGIRVAPSSGVAKGSVDRCRLEGNAGSGFLLSQTSTGIAFASIRNSVASANGIGLSALLAVQLNIESCLVANNGTGISSNSDFLGVSNSTVTNNVTGLSGSPLLSRTNNTVEGNTTDGTFTGTFTAK